MERTRPVTTGLLHALHRMWTGPDERELRMVWTLARDGRRSLLVGTAHFFPCSFAASTARYLGQVDTVLFEGPLDPASMATVVQAGREPGGAHLFDLLDRPTIAALTRAMSLPGQPAMASSLGLRRRPASEASLRDLVAGMKPWLAFFTLWTAYLRSRGWTHSVDLEAHEVATSLGKRVAALESIEEQIEVLQGLSADRIVQFLGTADRWPEYTAHYVQRYLAGELADLRSLTAPFPTRTPAAIERRDGIMYERMRPFLEQGRVAAFVGAPHVPGIRARLAGDGYAVDRPPC